MIERLGNGNQQLSRELGMLGFMAVVALHGLLVRVQ
jgi:hypothetical protein